MVDKLSSWRSKYRTLGLIFLMLISILILYFLVEAGYSYSWTGFGAYTPLQPLVEGYEREKTTWDWMQLLIVPAVLAIAAFFLNRTERINAEKTAEQRAYTEREIANQRAEQERQIAEQRSLDAVLETYLDRMTELLVDKQLLKSQLSDEVRDIAKIRTLTALRRLDSDRNKVLIQFLRDAGLFGGLYSSEAIINISRADLRQADLQGVNLQGIKLLWINLQGAKLQDAILSEFDLQGKIARGCITASCAI